MLRVALAAGIVLAFAETASAQSWVPWTQHGITVETPRARSSGAERPPARASERADRRERSSRVDRDEEEARPTRRASTERMSSDGGPQPHIAPQRPGVANVRTGHGAGTIVIDTSARRLYLMQSASSALVYPISVGRDGFQWRGTKQITRVASWPTWTPPAEMHARQPGLPQTMSGGVRNPLGAKALYLGSSLYRIHGNNSAQSVGQANELSPNLGDGLMAQAAALG
jgi:lipoprotein-anchoring transpeptidase ErfK/SrfK